MHALISSLLISSFPNVLQKASSWRTPMLFSFLPLSLGSLHELSQRGGGGVADGEEVCPVFPLPRDVEASVYDLQRKRRASVRCRKYTCQNQQYDCTTVLEKSGAFPEIQLVLVVVCSDVFGLNWMCGESVDIYQFSQVTKGGRTSSYDCVGHKNINRSDRPTIFYVSRRDFYSTQQQYKS